MANKPLILVTHGWLVDGSGPATQLIKDAYLDTHDVNVIVVDWRQIAHISYLSAAYKTADIGRQVRLFPLSSTRPCLYHHICAVPYISISLHI